LITSRLGISPVSLNVIDAVIQYANKHQTQLMLVASRNQVECADLGKGYVGDFTSKDFVSYVRNKDRGNILICRDHSGPHIADAEVELETEAALEKTLFSVKDDISAGFDLIHIDCSRHKGDVCGATSYLLSEALKYAKLSGRSVLFEVGTEENVGVKAGPKKFTADLEFILNLVRPEFIVGQTGSLVKEACQVGCFDCEAVKELVSIAHSRGVKFKEHNADYSGISDLHLRKRAGVDAINVGPEFGVLHTRTAINLAEQHGFHKEAIAFLKRSYESDKWRKWIYGEPSDFTKAVIAGHYVFGSDEYRELIDKLSNETDVNKALNDSIVGLLDHYVKGLS